jgi:hypothetical protein
MCDILQSDDESVQDLMDIEFPSLGISNEEDDADESDVSAPIVDIRSGWDNDAVNRCLNLALSSYNSMGKYEDFEPRINAKLASDSKSLIYFDSDKIDGKGTIASQENVHIEKQQVCKSDSPQVEDIFSNWIPKSL